VALAIGAGRVMLGSAFLAFPTFSVRILGLDTATAKRVRFLARMLAARDIGIGSGTLAACPGAGAAPWLLAGAGADAVDAAALAAAIRQGSARGPAAVGLVAGAAGAAALGLWAARGVRRA
jgi:hypothetical protein